MPTNKELPFYGLKQLPSNPKDGLYFIAPTIESDYDTILIANGVQYNLNAAKQSVVDQVEGELNQKITLRALASEVYTKAQVYTQAEIDAITQQTLASVTSGYRGTVSPTSPAPTLDGIYKITTDGTYTNLGGITVNRSEGGADFGMDVQIDKNGTVYTKINTPMPEVDTSVLVEKSDIIDNLITNDSEKPLSAKQGVEMKPRILPEGHEFEDLDRPDLGDGEFVLTVKDETGNVVAEIRDTKIIPLDIDRPDLGLVFVDDNGYILATGGDGGDQPTPTPVSAFDPLFHEPEDEPSFYLNEAPYDTVANYMAAIEEATGFLNWSPTFPTYVSRSVLGKSTLGNFDIFLYEFKPRNPKVKIVVTSCIHGIEKFVAAVMLRFVRDLCQNWMHDEAFTWFRHNVHFLFVPLASPYGFETLNRRVLETEAFPATWTKSGTTATITFSPDDFPTTNPHVSASNYFSHPGLAGLADISLINTSNSAGCPNGGYKIQSVVNGQTITITVPEGGLTSGTCQIYMSTDPNRGYDSEDKPWSLVPSTGLDAYNEPVKVAMSNKGTRPYSLRETVAIKELFEDHSDANAHIDLHSGAADYDTRRSKGDSNEWIYVRIVNEMHSQFTSKEMPFTVGASTKNSMTSESHKHSIYASTIEWDGFDSATALDGIVTADNWKQGYRWIVNTIINTAKYRQNGIIS